MTKTLSALVKKLRGELFALLFGAVALTAGCGGGGSNGGGNLLPPGGGGPPTPTPTPTVAPPSTYAVTGHVVHCDSTWIGVPPASPSPEPTAAPCSPATGLAGATITIGPTPSSGGAPASPAVRVTTAPDGSFTIANAPAGTDEVQVSMPAGQPCAEGPYPNNVNATPAPASVGLADTGNYAVFHGEVALKANTTLPTIHLTSLTQDEWCWYQQANIDRNVILGSQAPAANPPIDEYAQEIARAEAIGLGPLLVSTGSVGLFPQFGVQYTSNGGLWSYADGWIGVSSWESAEYEGISHPDNGPAATSPTDPNCTAWAVCSAMTKANSVYIGFSEDPTYRTHFAFVGISH